MLQIRISLLLGEAAGLWGFGRARHLIASSGRGGGTGVLPEPASSFNFSTEPGDIRLRASGRGVLSDARGVSIRTEKSNGPIRSRSSA